MDRRSLPNGGCTKPLPHLSGKLNALEEYFKTILSHVYSSLPPLRSGTGEIRLIHLHSGKLADPLECALSCTSFGIGPRYEALSYTWRSLHDGQELPSVPLRINGTAVFVLPNLGHALRSLRLEDRERVLWIDFLCINQADTVERGDQVRQMSTIYSRAEQAVVFLGAEAPNIEDALQLLTRLANGSEEHLPEMLESPTDPSAKSRRVQALEALLRSDWFSRVWTIQELVVAKQATLQYGRHRLPWEMLGNAEQGFNRHEECCERFRQINWAVDDLGLLLNRDLGRLRNTNDQFRHCTLRDLLARLWGQEATDKRDHIFALLGLLAPKERLVEVDYSRPYWEVYTDTALAILRRDKHLAHLVQVHNNHQSRDPALPTWVFDPSSARLPMALLPHAYDIHAAAGTDQSDVRRGSNVEEIMLSGFLIDTVSMVRKAEYWPGNKRMGILDDKTSLPTQEEVRKLYQYLKDIEYMAESLHQEASLPRIDHTPGGETGQQEELRTAAHITAACGVVRNSDRTITKLSAVYHPIFQKARHVLQTYSEGPQGRPITDFWDLIELDHIWPYCLTFTAFSQYAAFFLTSGNDGQPRRMGMGPTSIQAGDQIFILAGGNMPFVLRPEKDDQDGLQHPVQGRYELLGAAYVHGAMEGELVNGSTDQAPQWRDITLC